MQTPVSWGRPSCIEPSTGQDSFERTPTIIAPPQDLSDTITGTTITGMTTCMTGRKEGIYGKEGEQ